jgi:hypothetical protein
MILSGTTIKAIKDISFILNRAEIFVVFALMKAIGQKTLFLLITPSKYYLITSDHS